MADSQTSGGTVAEKKTIVVAGDLVWQENLVQASGTRLPDQAGDNVSVISWPGGAWWLGRAVKAACGDCSDLLVLEHERTPAANRSYAVWSQFPRLKGGKETVWRIRQFLGTEPRTGLQEVPAIPDDPANPDLLVIEDLGLGFHKHPEMWPAALRNDGHPGGIILSTCAHCGDGALWDRLIDGFADILTVVLPVSALRDRGAAISPPLSWDQTIEETAKEFEDGVSAGDVARARRVVLAFGNEGAGVFTRLPLDWEPQGQLLERARFERFLYDPECLEGEWTSRRPGALWNGFSTLAAALARHDLEPDTLPLFLALSRGLAAMRTLHEQGAGAMRCFPAEPDVAPLDEALRARAKHESAKAFFAAFPHSILHCREMKNRRDTESDLLQDLTGVGIDSVLSKGIDVVFSGKESALKPVPKAMFGKYFTVDREEIERINGIRNLIVTYLEHVEDRRPLSFAVFGPPGSGKSFAVKQLAQAVAKDRAQPLDFNLSQLGSVDDLHRAFHKVRDGAAQEKIPFVFWDEFDTLSLRWLKEFLAPMHDGVFHSGGTNFSFGKAVFVFAGGTASSFESFNQTDCGNDEFEKAKGPDFVSRLRGFIDIKAPNASGAKRQGADHTGGSDRTYLIRRAIMLRRAIEKHAPHLLCPETKRAAISPNLVRAFLLAEKYIHGARSLESLVSMSDLARARFFGPAQLPSAELMLMHVSKDFLHLYGELQLKAEDVEYLSEACHDAYRERRRAEGVAEIDAMLQRFADLTEETKESNRQSVRASLVHLAAHGYQLRCCQGGSARFKLPEEDRAEFCYHEHDRWLREKLMMGWTYADTKNGALQLNPGIREFDDLPEKEQVYDQLPVTTILRELAGLGYALEKKA
jgi:hypothetical protein